MQLMFYQFHYLGDVAASSENNEHVNSRGGSMSRASASHSGRSGNLKVTGLNPDLTFSNPGQVKAMTVKLILAAP